MPLSLPLLTKLECLTLVDKWGVIDRNWMSQMSPEPAYLLSDLIFALKVFGYRLVNDNLHWARIYIFYR